MSRTAYDNAVVTVEWPYEDHIPALRCPITGMVISLGFGPKQNPETDSPQEPADEKCPTLLFRYNNEIGMEYVQPEFARIVEEKKQELVRSGEFKDAEDIDDFEVISDHLDDLGEAPMVMNIPTWGLPGQGIVIGLNLAQALSRE